MIQNTGIGCGMRIFPPPHVEKSLAPLNSGSAGPLFFPVAGGYLSRKSCPYWRRDR